MYINMINQYISSRIILKVLYCINYNWAKYLVPLIKEKYELISIVLQLSLKILLKKVLKSIMIFYILTIFDNLTIEFGKISC